MLSKTEERRRKMILRVKKVTKNEEGKLLRLTLTIEPGTVIGQDTSKDEENLHGILKNLEKYGCTYLAIPTGPAWKDSEIRFFIEVAK